MGPVSHIVHPAADLPLLTRDGKEVRFYTDMLQGKVVLISFIYTNCTEICPILMPKRPRIQELHGDRSERDVSLISISADPEDDTPEVLKKYGEKYGAGPGWSLLTGKKENVDRWAKMRGDMAPEAVAAPPRPSGKAVTEV